MSAIWLCMAEVVLVPTITIFISGSPLSVDLPAAHQEIPVLQRDLLPLAF